MEGVVTLTDLDESRNLANGVLKLGECCYCTSSENRFFFQPDSSGQTGFTDLTKGGQLSGELDEGRVE